MSPREKPVTIIDPFTVTEHPTTASARFSYAQGLALREAGGFRSLESASAFQRSGGNGPNPDWASSPRTRTAPPSPRKRRTRTPKRFKLDDITREEPPSMRRHVTERPAAA